MIKTTRWSPDTCSCSVNIDWDTANPNVQTHTIVEPCSAHKNNDGGDIVAENQMKNKAIQIAAQNSAALATLTDDGKIIPDLKKLSFSFDSNRKLRILSSDKTVDMSKIQSELDSRLGQGKASIG